jgi:hypothetical protein
MNLLRRIRRHFEPSTYQVTAVAHKGTASVTIVYGRNVNVEVRSPCRPHCTCRRVEKVSSSD